MLRHEKTGKAMIARTDFYPAQLGETEGEVINVNIARDFSRYPAGRHEQDGPYSGEVFRREILAPALQQPDEKVVIEFDGARGYGVSFLEEAFGGLVRYYKFSADELMERLELKSADASLIREVKKCIEDACHPPSAVFRQEGGELPPEHYSPSRYG